MPELFGGPEVSQEMIIATIGNQNNPAQVVEIVHLPEKGDSCSPKPYASRNSRDDRGGVISFGTYSYG
jgi:hypothetical protein